MVLVDGSPLGDYVVWRCGIGLSLPTVWMSVVCAALAGRDEWPHLKHWFVSRSTSGVEHLQPGSGRLMLLPGQHDLHLQPFWKPLQRDRDGSMTRSLPLTPTMALLCLPSGGSRIFAGIRSRCCALAASCRGAAPLRRQGVPGEPRSSRPVSQPPQSAFAASFSRAAADPQRHQQRQTLGARPCLPPLATASRRALETVCGQGAANSWSGYYTMRPDRTGARPPEQVPGQARP
jgi:hypothetical protein